MRTPWAQPAHAVLLFLMLSFSPLLQLDSPLQGHPVPHFQMPRPEPSLLPGSRVSAPMGHLPIPGPEFCSHFACDLCSLFSLTLSWMKLFI